MSPYISGADRSQAVLFPEVIDDYIPADHPVRVLDAFVAQLDLVQLGFTHALANATGRPPYDPGDLLRLYLYGYLNRVRSSRRLEAEAGRNLELIWLLRRLKPDFKTIADFRRDNGPAIKAAAREFTLLCRKLDLFGGELVAIDGSKFRAQNSKDRNYSEAKLRALLAEIDAKTAAYFKELETQDKADAHLAPKPDAEAIKEKIASLEIRGEQHRAHLARLEQSGESQVSLTDPDARLMSQGSGSQVGYNVQAAVDAKHKLIVDTEVTNKSSDLGELGTMALKAQETLQAHELKVVADKGYYSGKEILLCDSIGVEAYVSKPLTSANTALGLYGKERFGYDKTRDVYVCPAGQDLTYRFSTQEKSRPLRYYRARNCAGCPLKGQCTRNKANRTITRLAFEEVQEAMAARVAEHPEIMRARKGITRALLWNAKKKLGVRSLPVSRTGEGASGNEPGGPGVQPEAGHEDCRSCPIDRRNAVEGQKEAVLAIFSALPIRQRGWEDIAKRLKAAGAPWTRFSAELTSRA